MSDKKDEVKQWYDGFTFGEHRDIYNPWSITNYLDEHRLYPYWASTSSNGLVSRLIRTASADVKEKMESSACQWLSESTEYRLPWDYFGTMVHVGYYKY